MTAHSNIDATRPGEIEVTRPKNVFVLSTGRCGSLTFANACGHMTNFTAGHETRCQELGDERLAYPDYHVESDNRLSWFLGRLDQKYGTQAVYVHLYRDPAKVAESYNNRWAYWGTIVLAYARGILQSKLLGIEPCADYVRTVTENIEHFLKDKTHVYKIDIDAPRADFERFWTGIRATGDLDAAVHEFETKANSRSVSVGDSVTVPSSDPKDVTIAQLERILELFHSDRTVLRQRLKTAETTADRVRLKWESALERSSEQAEEIGRLKEQQRTLNTELWSLQRHTENLREQRQILEADLAAQRDCAETLRAEKLALEREIAGKARKLSDLERSAESNKALAEQLAGSTSFRLGYLLVSHAKSPIGWVKLPVTVTRIIISRISRVMGLNGVEPRAQRNSELEVAANVGLPSRGSQPSREGKHLIYEAAEIGFEGSFGEAFEYVRSHGDARQILTANLFRANAAGNDDTLWAESLNAYLAQFGLTPIVVRTGDESRFFRITSEPGYTLDHGPLVSVIMPAFNAEKTIAFAVDSILNQTWRNLELVVVDDASSDQTWQLLRALAESNPRLKILRNSTNVGPYVSKNRALSVIRGEYLTGHDADDWAHPQRIEKHMGEMLQHSHTKVSLNYMLRMDESGFLGQFMKVGKTSFDGAVRLASISCLFEKDTFFEKLGHWDPVRFGADSELIERARIVIGEGFKTVPMVGMLCLDADGSLTNHPEYGINAGGRMGLSPTRAAYRASWTAWHKTLSDGQNNALPFVHAPRLFDAPEEMIVPPDIVQALARENAERTV